MKLRFHRNNLIAASVFALALLGAQARAAWVNGDFPQASAEPVPLTFVGIGVIALLGVQALRRRRA